MQRLRVAAIVAGLGLTGAVACSAGSTPAARGSVSPPSATSHASSGSRPGATAPVTATGPAANPIADPGAATTTPSAATLVSYVRTGRAVSGAGYRVGASAPGQPMIATPGVDEFTTPSGNISCGILGSGVQVTCSVKDYSFATPPRPANCQLNYAPGWVSLDSSGVTRSLCLGGPPFAPISRTLSYGSTLSEGQLSCRSEAAFLACADTGTGHGFVVNRTVLTTY